MSSVTSQVRNRINARKWLKDLLLNGNSVTIEEYKRATGRTRLSDAIFRMKNEIRAEGYEIKSKQVLSSDSKTEIARYYLTKIKKHR